jgi:hypothetical protein
MMEVEVEPTTGKSKKMLAILKVGERLLALLVIGGLLLAAVFAIKDYIDQRAESDDGLKSYGGYPRIATLDRTYQERSPALCNGDEIICTTLITNTPAETLQSLIAAIPKGDAKRYKLRLAVVPIEEFDETFPETQSEPVLKPIPLESH